MPDGQEFLDVKLTKPRMSANLNITANETAQSPSCATPGTLAEITFVFSLILVVSLAGNTSIGVIVYRTKTMRKTINYFIVNMAMSDLLVPIIVVPLILTDLHVCLCFFGFQLGQTFCNLMIFLQYLSAIMSIESLLLIGVDRFGAVVFPLRPPLIGSKLSPFLVLVTWIIAIGLSFPAFFAYKPVEFTGKFRCSWQWIEGSVGYYSDRIRTVRMAFVVASFAVIVVLYSIIVFKLKSQKIPGELSVNAQEQRVKRQRKVVKMALAIVVTFALCWGPITLSSIVNVFVFDKATRSSCGLETFKFIAVIIAEANCALNPMICFIFSENYRQGLKGLFRCYGAVQG